MCCCCVLLCDVLLLLCVVVCVLLLLLLLLLLLCVVCCCVMCCCCCVVVVCCCCVLLCDVLLLLCVVVVVCCLLCVVVVLFVCCCLCVVVVCCCLCVVVVWFWTFRFSPCLSGCRLKPRPLRGRRGFTRQPENSKRVHFRVPALQTPPKFHEKTPRETQKERNGGGRGKKNARNFWPPTLWTPHPSGPHLPASPSGPLPSGPHPLGPPPFGARFFLCLGPTLLGPHHDTHQIQKWIGQSRSLPRSCTERVHPECRTRRCTLQCSSPDCPFHSCPHGRGAGTR